MTKANENLLIFCLLKFLSFFITKNCIIYKIITKRAFIMKIEKSLKAFNEAFEVIPRWCKLSC